MNLGNTTKICSDKYCHACYSALSRWTCWYAFTFSSFSDVNEHNIGYPQRDQLDNIGQGFAHLAQHDAFSKAVGAIDGCHICIKPPNTHKEDYFNYKQFHSIQMQAICDDTGRFINVFIGYPGSVHDTRIFKNSPIYLNAEYPPKGYFLLDDGGYPCLETP